MKQSSLPALLCLLLSSLRAAAPAEPAALANWPQWRGPLASGVAPQADPPLTWSETKNVRWKVKIPGSGTATPILWENKLFVLTAVPTGRKLDPAEAAARKAALATLPSGGTREVSTSVEPPQEFLRFTVICLDRQTGRTVWEKVACEEAPHEGHHRNHGYASASPVTDGSYLIVSFGSRGLYCYSLSGELVWKKDLGKLHTRKSFGEASSPALHGDTVVVVRDHEEEDLMYFCSNATGRMTCLNARTGEPHFEAERIQGLQNLYASPVAAKDRVYVLSREGSCVVLKQGPKLEVLATNALDEKTDASMVLAGKDAFIRGQAHLYRIAEE